MGKTAGEYDQETEEMLMGKSYYKPYEVRNRVQELLRMEAELKKVCKAIVKRNKLEYCIKCGWSHADGKQVN